MKVFWSWQADTDRKTGKVFVQGALKDAITELGNEFVLDPAERPEIDHDTKDEPGTPPIVQTIFGKIEKSGAFCADVTPVGASYADDGVGNKKLLPNPNVMFELGYAQCVHPYQRIILIANRTFLPRPEALPFDLRGDRAPILYSLAPSADKAALKAEHKNLVGSLKNAITRVLDYNRGAGSINSPIGNPDTRTTWFAQGQTISFVDHFVKAKKTIQLRTDPHAYMRVNPSEWPDHVRSAQMSPDASGQRFVLSGRASNGDWGQATDGFLYFLSRRSDPDANPRVVDAVAQWSAGNGELWGVWGDVVEDGHFFGRDVINSWTRFLRQAITELTRVGAKGPFVVRAGVTGIDGVRWHEGMRSGNLCARSDVSKSATVTTEDLSQFKYVAVVANQLTDAFGMPDALTEADVANMIGIYLPTVKP